MDLLFPFHADLKMSFEKVDLLIIRRNEYIKWVPNLDLPFSIFYENEVLVLGKPGNRGEWGWPSSIPENSLICSCST